MIRMLPLLGWLVFVLAAQTPPPGNAPAAPAPAERLVLNSAYCADGSARKECELGDTVVLRFSNLKEWCDSADHDLKALVLILDGRLMSGLHPVAPMPCDNELRFELKRLDDSDDVSKQNRDAWNVLLSRAHTDRKTFRLSVGMDASGSAKPVCFNATDLTVRIFPSYKWLVYLFLMALVAAFLLLAAMSGVVRDRVAIDGRRPFSLARCQMAWWFFLVLGAYHYIWMVTGDRDSLTPGVLILIGISAATGLGATVVDGGNAGQKTGGGERNPFRRFINDILRDDDGVSFHRFQLAVWTIVLGFVFVVAVYKSLAMPDFSATLLGLMGISSGTYIGFKIPNSGK